MQTQSPITKIDTKQRDSKSLAQAMESEIRLLRYWVLQTLQNYKSWRQSQAANSDLSARKIANMQGEVKNIIGKSLREYRRKQSLLQNLVAKQPYFSAQEIQYYRIENHFGAGVAAMFANDNSPS